MADLEVRPAGVRRARVAALVGVAAVLAAITGYLVGTRGDGADSEVVVARGTALLVDGSPASDGEVILYADPPQAVMDAAEVGERVETIELGRARVRDGEWTMSVDDLSPLAEHAATPERRVDLSIAFFTDDAMAIWSWTAVVDADLTTLTPADEEQDVMHLELHAEPTSER